MTANVAPVRAVPGRSQDGNRCRRCSEIETLPHVLGSCPFGERLRNCRHHIIRSSIAKALEEKGFSVFEEVHGLATNGSCRRIDMIVFRPSEKKGHILDPTIRFESHASQPHEVDEEKRAIYLPTVNFYKNQYHLEEIEVRGLMIGARGTIPGLTAKILKSFGLPTTLLFQIGIEALKGSIAILKNHLYSRS